jgi:hypothetical protein
MFIHTSPRAAVLAGPYVCRAWASSDMDFQDLISEWMAAISAVPYTEEVAESVVDTLLQISVDSDLRQFIPADIWLWLNKRPSLPPVCKGRGSGSACDTVRTVRALNNIGILMSYLITIWSEWNHLNPSGFAEMQISVREDLNGIGMGCHRGELIQRLDYILGELDRRSGPPDANLEDDALWRDQVGHLLPRMKDQYGLLKRILEEVDQEATQILNRMPPNLISLGLLNLIDLHRISLHLRVCPASPVTIVSHFERLALFLSNHFLHPQSVL